MSSLFDNPFLPKDKPSLFRGAETLSAGGTLSQAALATLTNPTPPNGDVAEPPIVEAGVRDEKLIDDEKKHAYWMIALAVVGLLVLGAMVRK